MCDMEYGAQRERKSHFNIWHCMLGLSCGAAVSAVDDNDDDEDGEQILDFFSTFNLSLALCLQHNILDISFDKQ